MATLQEMECKNCGATLDMNTAVNGVIKCPFCRSTFTVAKQGGSPIVFNFLRQGEHDLDTCKFDEAYTAFAKASQYDAKEPEAYWGMAIAEFKVQYIRDSRENRLQPICHEFNDRSFVNNRNYINALKFATEEQKAEYVKKAQEIDYVRSEFLKLQQSGLNYDCFICVKVSRIDNEQTDPTKKNWTEDAYDADAIYDLLKRNGYSPFYSEREIRGRSGVDYEAMILYALYTAETMLVVCRNEEYLQTPWVKNEYTRFRELVNNKEKENDSLTFVYNGRPIEKLPGSNGKIQGIDYSRREADFEIVKFVDTHTPAAKAKREAEKRKKDEEAEALKKQIAAQIEEQKKVQQVQQELERKLNSLNSASTARSGATATVDSLLTRARQELSFKEFDNAKDYFNKVLDADPQNADGWWGLFLVEFGVTDEGEILEQIDNKTAQKVSASRNFKSAVKYAGAETKQRIDKFTNGLNSPECRWKLFLDEFSVNHESELLDAMCEEMLNSIESSANYGAALNGAEGDLKKRVENFRTAMHSGEVWWKCLLKQFNARSGTELIRRATNQQLFDLPQNSYYKNAYKYASGDFSAIMNAFIGELFSFRLWWGRFLADYKAKNEEEILFNFKYEYRTIPQSNQCYLRAKKYATDDEKKVIARFEANLEKQINEYNLAQESWDKLLKEFKCNSESDLQKLKKNIDESQNFRDAIGHARNSKDKELLLKYSSIGHEQGKSAEENLSQLRLKRLANVSKFIVALTIIFGVAMAVTGILSYISIEPFGSFWFRFTVSTLGSAGWRWLVIVVPLVYIIIMTIILIAAWPGKGKSIFSIIFSGVFIAVAAFSALSGYTLIGVADGKNSNSIETDTYIIWFSEQTDEKNNSTYIVSDVYFKAEIENFVVPDTFEAKKVTEIGKRAFRNCKADKITLGNNIVKIGDKAFKGGGFEYINIPASVKYIGAGAFANCNSRATVDFDERMGWYRTYKDDYNDGMSVDSHQLQPEAAISYLGYGTFYLYHH